MLGILLFLMGLYYLFLDFKFGFVIVFFGLITNGFQIVPISLMTVPQIGITKCYDLGLVLMVLYIISRQKQCASYFFRPEFRLIRYILYFVLIEVIVSLYIYKYAPAVVVRVLRSYLFFLSFLIFSAYDIKQLNRLMIILVWITFAQALIYDFQNVVGTQILNQGLDEAAAVSDSNAMGGLIRFYNTPVFLVAAYAYLMIFRSQFKKSNWWLLLLTFFSVVLLSMHRSLLISFVMVTILSYLRSVDVYKRIMLFGVTVALFFLSINLLPERLSSGFSNLSELGGLSLRPGFVSANYVQNQDENSSMYRAYHFIERLQYVLEKPIRVAFGIGFLTEDAPQASQLNFIVGIEKEGQPGEVDQIDTGDITWSQLILQLGLVGTLLYLYMILFYMIYLFARSKNNDFAFAGSIFLLAQLLISFFGTELASPYTRTFLCLFLMCYLKFERYQNDEKSLNTA
jgi:hypothetical protein